MDGIKVVYRGYPVNVGGGHHLPLGHAAVVSVDKNGRTRYYEYGRYDPAKFGEVKWRTPIPDLVMKDGKPTQESLDKLYDFLSENFGKGRPVKAKYYDDADAQGIIDFANERMKDPHRKKYNILTNSCYNFAGEAIRAGQEREKIQQKQRDQEKERNQQP